MKDRSKLLAYILRHSPESVGVNIHPGGWVSVGELTEKSDFTVDELTSIVTKEILRLPGINLVALKSGAQKRSTPSAAAQKKVFIKIDKLQITDSSVSFKYKWQFGFSLPDYRRQEIGKEGNLTPDQLAAEVYDFHLKEMQLKVIRKLEEIKKASEDRLKNLMTRIKKKYSQKKEQENAK